MEGNKKQEFLHYLLALRDALLTFKNGTEFVEELFVKNYNEKLTELEKVLNYDLSNLKINKEDEFFSLEDDDYLKYPVGFIHNTNSSTTPFEIIDSIYSSKKYKKLNFLVKLNQVILLLQSSK